MATMHGRIAPYPIPTRGAHVPGKHRWHRIPGASTVSTVVHRQRPRKHLAIPRGTPPEDPPMRRHHFIRSVHTRQCGNQAHNHSARENARAAPSPFDLRPGRPMPARAWCTRQNGWTRRQWRLQDCQSQNLPRGPQPTHRPGDLPIRAGHV